MTDHDADLAALALIRAAGTADEATLNDLINRYGQAGRVHVLFLAVLEIATNATANLAEHHRVTHDEFVDALELEKLKEATR